MLRTEAGHAMLLQCIREVRVYAKPVQALSQMRVTFIHEGPDGTIRFSLYFTLRVHNAYAFAYVHTPGAITHVFHLIYS